MNRKGFTLIELLAVIIVMSLILMMVIPVSLKEYKDSRLKVEDAFVKRLSQMVDSYVTLNSGQLSFNRYQDGTKFAKPSQTEKVTVSVANININDLINDKIIKKSDYVNPNNKKTTCDVNAQIEVYKDSDFVYCHKIKATSLECITPEYIEKYLNNNSNSYIIDTCIWMENNE